MQPVAWIRNALIFAGLAAGGAFAIVQAVSSGPEESQPAGQVAEASPIMLNTAKPPAQAKTPLNKPLSLESAFGRSELTGLPVSHVPDNPLDELDFDRRWDVSMALRPPKPPADLPPERASDEVVEPQTDDNSLNTDPELADLPNEAKQRAEAALVSLRDGTKLLKEGMNEFRRPGEEGVEGSRKVRKAADLLRDARDKLENALKLAPQHPELLRLMQEAKANLYICLKHGM
jgi:hypothetical protein